MRYFVALILLLSCNVNNRSIEIFPLYPFLDINKNGSYYRTEYYCVKNIDIEDSLDIKRMDSIVCATKSKNIEKYRSYQMLFYVYGENINENYKHDSEQLIEWEGDKILLEYNWSFGKFTHLVFNPNIERRRTSFIPRFNECK